MNQNSHVGEIQGPNWESLNSPVTIDTVYSPSGRPVDLSSPTNVKSSRQSNSSGSRSLLLEPRRDHPTSPVGTVTEEVISWQSISSRILPLFIGESLRMSILLTRVGGHIEDLNEMISHWSKEATTTIILVSLNDLFRIGVASLSKKLNTAGSNQSYSTLSESVLIAARVADLWSFFFGNVVPSIQGYVFL
jgi:hypothetical protein